MDEQNKELARRLGCACVSYFGGISLKYAYDRYFKDEEPNEYWSQLASQVIADFREGKIVNFSWLD